MSNRILHDEGMHPLGMGQGYAKTHGTTVILHVERKAREPECFGEVIRDFSEVIERIGELFWIRPVAVAKARIVWRYQVIAIRKPREQGLKHPG
jgi:hypothetical protein